MSAEAIKAGEAFVEATVRDGTAKGIVAVNTKLRGLAFAVQGVSAGFAVAGAALASAFAAGSVAVVGVVAYMRKAVGVFYEVSEYAAKTGAAIAGFDKSKGIAFIEAWKTFKAVLKAIAFQLGSALAEPLTAVLKVGIICAITLFHAAEAAVAFATGVLAAVAAFSALDSVALDTLAGILAAIATGDIARAFAIVGKAVEVIWDGVMASLKMALVSAFQFIISETQRMIFAMSKMLEILQKSLGQVFGRKFDLGAGALRGAGGALGGIGAAIGVGLKADLDKTLAEMGNDLAGLLGNNSAAKAKFMKAWTALGGLGGLNHLIGGSSPGGGSQAGSFSGAASSLLGVGPGGGQKVSDDATHDKLDAMIWAIKAIKGGAVLEFK